MISRARAAGTAAAAVVAAAALGWGSTGRAATRPAAVLAGSPAIPAAAVDSRVDAVFVGAVATQFDRSEVRRRVLEELVAIRVDEVLAARLGVAPDPARESSLLAAGIAHYRSPAAYQESVLRDVVARGHGWAGAADYVHELVLLDGIAHAESVAAAGALPPAVLKAEFDAHRGDYESAHLQVLTTPDAALGARLADRARADPALFPSLVMHYGDDPVHRASGGDYGDAVPRGTLYAQIDDAVYAAPAGAVVGPITIAQSPPETWVVRVLSTVEHPYATVLPQLRTRALQPDGDYIQALVARARSATALALAIQVDPVLGQWQQSDLTVRP